MFRLLPRHPRAASKPARALLACPACDADALCPMEWETLGDEQWLMSLRCGECGNWLTAAIPNATAAEMDIELDRQQRLIAAAADMLEAERMAAEAEIFVSALERDLIDADDFAR